MDNCTVYMWGCRTEVSALLMLEPWSTARFWITLTQLMRIRFASSSASVALLEFSVLGLSRHRPACSTGWPREELAP